MRLKWPKTQAFSRSREKRAVRFLERTLAAHYGIDSGTKRNHNGNVVPFRAARIDAARSYVCRDAGSLEQAILVSCDLVAIRGEEPPLVVIGELKLGFNLELVLQGINRMAACDQVWLAVRFTGRRGRERDPRVRKLCRLLGFGLLGVSTSGRVEVLVEPRPWRPRRDARRRSRLLAEHRRRLGDPVLGGSCKAPIRWPKSW